MARILCNLINPSSHLRMATPVPHPNDFDITFKFWARVETTQIMLGDYANNQNFVADIAGGALRVRIGGVDIQSANGVLEAKKYYTCRLTRVGSTVTGYLDDVSVLTGTTTNTFTLDSIGTYNNGALSFSGYISDVNLGDYAWNIDEASAATEDSTPTGNAVTYTSIPAGQRHTFTESAGGEYWWGDNNERLELDVAQPSTSTYMIIGQSNPLSRAALRVGVDDVYSTLNGRVMAWDYELSERVGAANPLNHIDEAPTSMGFWRKMCLGLSAPNLLMLPLASGGTGYGTNDWNQGDPSYNHAVTQTNLATASTPSTLDGVVIILGETDGDLGRTATQQSTSMQAMRTGMITDIPAMTADTPWVVVEIGAVGANYDEINAGLALFVASIPNGTLIPNTGLTLLDQYHYDAESIDSIGVQVAAAFEPVSLSDYCFEVMISPSDHIISDTERDAARWAVGDIIEIYPAAQMGVRSGNAYTPHNPVGMPRTGWIFIRDVPDNIPAIGDIDLDFLRAVFVTGWDALVSKTLTVSRAKYDERVANGITDPFIGEITVLSLDAIEATLQGDVPVNLRKRRFTIDQAPNAFKIQMRDFRYANATYANAKPYIWNKRYSRLFDELQDLASGN